MGLAVVLALAAMGLNSAFPKKGRGGDRHCDYTRPGVEPWWSDPCGDVTERPQQPGVTIEHPVQ